MTDILNNLTNDVGSDREDIQKLFPKCKPKSDVNLNKLIIRDSSKHQHQLNNRNNICSDEGRFHGIGGSGSFLANQHRNESSLLQADDASSSNSIRHVNNLDNTVVENNYRDHMVIVDNTVVSAYDMDMDNCHKVNGAAPLAPSQHQQPEEDESAYDESLDVGYRIPVMRKEFKLRESRIEIAGGREVFSSSRSRPSKKRFSDEIQFRPAASEHQHNRDVKRHSGGETLYDDHVAAAAAGAHQLKSASAVTRKTATAEIVSLRSSHHQSNGQWTAIKHQNRFKARTTAAASRLNKVTCNVDDSPSDPLYGSGGDAARMSIMDRGTGSGKFPDQERDAVTPEGTSSKQRDTFVLKGQRSGMFIYETVVRGSSEVVYDDIEEHRSCFKQAEADADAEAMMTSERDDVGSPPTEFGIGFTSSPDRLETDVVVAAAGQSPDADTMDVVDDKISVAQTQLIGSLPIAQYEGSPRRYGPRPGHPQRMTMVSDVTAADDGEMITSPNDVITSAEAAPMVADGGGGGGDNDVDVLCPSEGSLDGVTVALPPPASSSSFSTYDYLYEESETRKVLEEFYHQDGLFERLKAAAGTLSVDAFNELEYRLYRNHAGNSYVGRRLAHSNVLGEVEDSPKKRRSNAQLLREHLLAATLNSIVAGSGDKPCLSKENLYNFNLELGSCFQPTLAASLVDHVEDQDKQLAATLPLPATLPPHGETAASTALDSAEDLAETEVGEQVGQSRNFTLSPETTECDSNDVESEVSMENEGSLHSSSRQYASMPVLEDGLSSGHSSEAEEEQDDEDEDDEDDADEDDDEDEDGAGSEKRSRSSDHHVLTTLMMKKQISEIEREIARRAHNQADKSAAAAAAAHGTVGGPSSHRSIHLQQQQHFQQPHVQPSPVDYREVEDYLRRCDTMSLPVVSRDVQPVPLSTDPLEHMLDSLKVTTSSPLTNQVQRPPPLNSSITCESVSEAINEIKQAIQRTKSITLKSPPMEKPEAEDVPVWVLRPTFKHKPTSEEEEGVGRTKEEGHEEDECDTDQETDRLLGEQRSEDPETFDAKRLSDLPSTQPPSSPITNADPSASLLSQEKEAQKKKGRTKEVLIHEPAVLIEGVLFRARYLGSTQLVCEGQPTKATRMMQAEEAVSSIKAPEGETQPSTEVDLFISTEKIMVLNTDLKEIMMDHALRTISYIADIGDLVVLMARRRVMSTTDDLEPKLRRTPKMICHVFESEEAQFIAQSIGQAFQVAYMEFLKANGIEDHSFVKEMDYQEVLNSQEIYGDELEMFAKKEMQKEVIVPKLKGEILGVVIVESGWGSMLPTVVIANLSPNGAAARCGQLNIGDQIIAVNGISLVGLPLSTCQNYVKNAKNQTVVKLTVVPCAPVVEVKIKRPDTKYQLGFSVQNGVICSLLRGGIAERGGVRVGHRIIEINGQSVVAVPHERIVNLLATSVGEIHMKTMPTSMFRLLTGQESPIFI